VERVRWWDLPYHAIIFDPTKLEKRLREFVVDYEKENSRVPSCLNYLILRPFISGKVTTILIRCPC
jgi:hypothetical protein